MTITATRIGTMRRRPFAGAIIGAAFAAATLAVALGAGAPAARAAEHITFAAPGVPPVWAGVVEYVAEQAGFFRKYGVDVTMKAMDSGAEAAKAVEAGSIDATLAPTQFLATMIANSGAPVVAIGGEDKGDWMIGSMDPNKTSCASMKGQGVGVDTPHGARWIQINTYLVKKCHLVTDKDVPTVPLSSNVGTAMASGQLTFGVLHIDDIPVIERMSGKKVHIIAHLEDVAPGIHYIALVVRKDNLAKKHDAFVRFLAAVRDAAQWMHDPKNADKAATIAMVTKRDKADALKALAAYNKMQFWPLHTAGLDKARVERAIANQVNVGKISKGRSGINPSKKPPTYAQMVDLSVWRAAEKLKK